MKLQGDQNGFSVRQPSPTEIKKRRERLIGNPPKPEPKKVVPTVSEPKGLRGKDQVKYVIMDKALVDRIAVLEAENAYLKKSLEQLEPGRPVSVGAIQHYVAKNWGVRRVDLLSSRRTKGVTEPRHVAMYFSKNFTMQSLPELGRMFGGRDHTTVLHAVQKVTLKRTLDPDFDAKVAKLERYFEQAERRAEGDEADNKDEPT